MTHSIFSGLKVIELASVLAGPTVGQFFAELGAEVIKVENPKTKGDVTRSWKSANEKTDDISAYFSAVNWGKKSVAIDYSQPEGLKLLYKLIEKSEMVISSFKPGDAEKLRVDFKNLKKPNPNLIYGSLTGYGKEDDRVGYDAVIQAESGFMYLNGEPEGKPLKLPVALMDVLAGHQLKEALLLAYIEKLKTGRGQEVTVSLIDAAISALVNQGANWLVGNSEPKRSGSLHPNIAPYGETFTTADNQQILLAIGSDQQFQKLCEILHAHHLPQDQKFRSNADRVKNREELAVYLSREIAKVNAGKLIKLCNEQKIPAAQIKTVSEAIESNKKLLLESTGIKGLPTFIGKSGNQRNSSHILPPPHFAQHTNEVLIKEIDLSEAEIDVLRSQHVIL